MRKVVILYFLLSFGMLQAQMIPKLVEISKEKVGKTYQIYARNTNPCPVSVLFTFESNNTCGIPSQRILVEANAQKQLLFTIAACNPKNAFKFNYRFNYWLGDTELSQYDKSFVYMLPFPEGTSYKVMQGYFGEYSHQNEHSIDFEMPEGSKIVAMRAGVVVLVKQDSNRGGGSKSFANDGNYVLIYHEDGTFASYFHLKKDGSVVQEGEKVQQGQLIGYSGNTGWSSSPHLHISIFSFKPKLNEKNMLTYSSFFMVGKNPRTILEKDKRYTSVRP